MKKIDVHGHLGHWWFPIPNTGTAESLLRLCERYDIEHVAVSSTLAITHDMRGGNAEVAQAVERHKQLLGYCYCNPNFLEESCEEMDTYLPLDGFVGVKIHAGYSACATGDAKMHGLVAEIATRTSVVKIHTGGANVAQHLATYAADYPELNIIIAHAMGGEYRTAADLAGEHGNIYLDFCSSGAYRGKVEYALQTCGARQIVFGSDMDLLDPAFTLGQFEGAQPTDQQRRAMYYENAARIFGLQT
jgi:predicted TIM-barrel fold metal-dependent hydrolase